MEIYEIQIYLHYVIIIKELFITEFWNTIIVRWVILKPCTEFGSFKGVKQKLPIGFVEQLTR